MLSRFLPPATGEPSIYETLRQHDESDHSDIEERAGMTIDKENLGSSFYDYDLGGFVADPAAVQAEPSKNRGMGRPTPGNSRQKPQTKTRRPQHTRGTEVDDLDDEVPQSLLIEGDEAPTTNAAVQHQKMRSPPVPGPGNGGIRAQWQAAQEQQRLHPEPVPPQGRSGPPGRRVRTMIMDHKERALWMWANVENLDNFLSDIYEYYTGKGIWSITLGRMLYLL